MQHFATTPDFLEKEPDFLINFMRDVPSVWDETRYISGEPEKHIAIARRKRQAMVRSCSKQGEE